MCYNLNSLPQQAAVQASIPFIHQAIDALDVTTSASLPLIIADFGSSQGLNSIYAMKIIIDYVQQTKHDPREPVVIHNDWPSIFQVLNEDKSYKSVANGCSFYGECSRRDSLSIGYSSSVIHWLSAKRCNISDHCCVALSQVSKEREAFKHQARVDYSHFLEHRSREFLPGAVLILAILCTNTEDKTDLEATQNLLYKCAQSISLTPEELLNYIIPFYFRSYNECVRVRRATMTRFDLAKRSPQMTLSLYLFR